MKPRLLSFDLDGTLAYFNQSQYGSLADFFARHGVPSETFKLAYEKTRLGGGFSPERFLTVLADQYAIKLETKKVLDEVYTRLKQTLTLFPDASSVMGPSNHTRPTAIVSFGDAQFQNYKIKLLNLAPDRIYIVNAFLSKAKPLREIITAYGAPVIHVDDSAPELDAIRRAGLSEEEVITYHLVRGNTPWPDEKPDFPHRRISSLTEVLA